MPSVTCPTTATAVRSARRLVAKGSAETPTRRMRSRAMSGRDTKTANVVVAYMMRCLREFKDVRGLPLTKMR